VVVSKTVFTCIMNKAPMESDCVERVAAQIRLCAEHALCKVMAELEGKVGLAEAWRATAKTRERALIWRYEDEIADVLCHDILQTLTRADALADQARLMQVATTQAL
jgi:hypothetical protein